MRDPLSVGVYEFPRTPNKLDEYLKQEERAAAAAAKKKPTDEFEDLDQLGGVWERDVENLTKDFIDFKKKRVEYEQEKDQAKKAGLWQEGVKMGAKLKTNIQKSKTNKQQHNITAVDINKDNRMLYPEDAADRLEKWASMSIYDRPDNIGIEKPSSLDFISEANKKFKAVIGKPNIASDKFLDRTGKVTIEKGKQYYTEDDVNMALESTINSMPGNYIRSEKKRLQDAIAYGSFDEAREAREALATEESLKEYLKRITYAAIEPSINVAIAKTTPAPQKKPAGGGGGSQAYQVQTAQEQFGVGDAGTIYTSVTSSKKTGQMPKKQWQIPTILLKEANEKYKLGLDDYLRDIDAATTPSVSIEGIFLKASRNQKTGEMTVTIQPDEQFLNKYKIVKGNITLPLVTENLANVNAYLNDRDVRDLFKEEEQKNPRIPGTKKKEAPTPTGAKKKKKPNPYQTEETPPTNK